MAYRFVLVSVVGLLFSALGPAPARAWEDSDTTARLDAYRIEIPEAVTESPQVGQFLKWFTQSGKLTFRQALARSGRYLAAMTHIFREEGLPEDLIYLCSIESEFSPVAYSSTNTSGLWQFTETTGLHYGLKINPWLDERRDPIKSTRAAAAYLRDLHTQFKDWLLVVAAYNAGENSVKAALNRLGKQSLPLFKTPFPKPTTADFVARFVAATMISRKPASYGFQGVSYHDAMQFDEVLITEPLRLTTIAELADTSVDALRQLNPALLQDSIPPQNSAFPFRLPSGQGETFVRAYRDRSDATPLASPTHQVKAGETLWQIARHYGVSVEKLMKINHLEGPRLRIGQRLLIGSGAES